MGQQEQAIYRQWLANDGQRPLRCRIGHLVCETAHRLQSRRDEDMFIPLTAGEIARALGSVPLYVERELVELREEGLIELERDGVVIRDPARLSQDSHCRPTYLEI